VTAICLTASLHAHLELMVYTIPFIYLLITLRKNIKPLTWIGMIVSSGVVLSPLIMFEYFKHGQNIFLPFRLFTRIKSGAGGSVGHGLDVLLQSVGQLFFAKPYDAFTFPFVINCLALIAVLFLIFLVIKKSKTFLHILLGSLSLFYIWMIILWPGDVHTHYLLGFFPLFALVLGYGLSFINLKILIPLILVFITLNTYSVVKSNTAYGLKSNKELIQKISQYVGDKPFYLENKTDGFYGGFRYLFKIYGKMPVASSTDYMFSWLYPNELLPQKSELRVVIGYPDSTKKPLTIIKGKGYSGYIYEYK
jgi:hypothetical protein